MLTSASQRVPVFPCQIWKSRIPLGRAVGLHKEPEGAPLFGGGEGLVVEQRVPRLRVLEGQLDGLAGHALGLRSQRDAIPLRVFHRYVLLGQHDGRLVLACGAAQRQSQGPPAAAAAMGWRVQVAWRDSEENSHWSGAASFRAAWRKLPFRTTDAPGCGWSPPTGSEKRDKRGVAAETPMLASSRVRATDVRRYVRLRLSCSLNMKNQGFCPLSKPALTNRFFEPAAIPAPARGAEAFHGT